MNSTFVRLTAISCEAIAPSMAVVRADRVVYAVGREHPPHRTRVVLDNGSYLDVAEAPGEVSALVDFALGEGDARG